MFVQYAFDTWLDRAFPTAQFERCTDDAVACCVSERQAGQGLAALGDRRDRRPLRWSARRWQAAQGAEQVQVHAAEVHRVRAWRESRSGVTAGLWTPSLHLMRASRPLASFIQSEREFTREASDH